MTSGVSYKSSPDLQKSLAELHGSGSPPVWSSTDPLDPSLWSLLSPLHERARNPSKDLLARLLGQVRVGRSRTQRNPNVENDGCSVAANAKIR
jgi:hypothetical protein